MVAQAGRLLLIEIDTDGVPTWVAVGGLRSKSLDRNNEIVDTTCDDSTNQQREILAGAGVRSMTISGSGVFKDSATELLVEQASFNDTHLTIRFTVPSFVTYSGVWAVPNYQNNSEYNGAVQFSATFESAGAITRTAL